MASKLNPGADATLVNAAYRAALANTPKDYSGALESVARGYEKTMQSSAEMWKDIATVGSAIGADMIKTSNEFAAAAAKGAALDSDSATFFYDEIDALKDEFKELGLLPGIFGDRDTKRKRAELRLKQAELFAEIDNAANSIAQGAAAISAGTYDHSLNMRDSDMINAIIKSNLKNKITDQDNYAKLSRDEETGELMYTLYKKDGSLATLVPGGPAQTMTMTQFNEAIAKNKKDGGAMLNSLNTRIDNHYNNGLKSTDGVYDDKMRAADINFIEALLGDDPINLKRAMQTRFGYSETSFYDDITSGQNEYSAELFSTLLSVTGGGNVLKGKITEGMVDTDGEEGISAQEAMDSNNYKILTGNILGLKDAKVSKEFFKQYAVKNYQDSFEYGYSKKPPVEGGDNENNLTGFLNTKKSVYSNTRKSYFRYNDAKALYDAIKTASEGKDSEENIDGILYKYDSKNNNWYAGEGEDRVDYGDIEKFIKNWGMNDPDFIDLIPQAEVSTDGKPIPVDAAQLEAKKKIYKKIFDKIAIADIDDDAAADDLNALLDLDKASSKLKFMPYSLTATESALRTGAGGTGFFSADAAGTDDLMLYNPRTGEVVKDSNGNRIRFETGENIKELSEDGSSAQIEKIINTLIEQGIIIPGLNDKAMTAEDYVNER